MAFAGVPYAFCSTHLIVLAKVIGEGKGSRHFADLYNFFFTFLKFALILEEKD